jgi:hypothetical protein
MKERKGSWGPFGIYLLDTTANSANLNQNWTYLSKCFTKSLVKGAFIILVKMWANSSTTLVILENGNALNESFIEFRVDSKPTNFAGTPYYCPPRKKISALIGINRPTVSKTQLNPPFVFAGQNGLIV